MYALNTGIAFPRLFFTTGWAGELLSIASTCGGVSFGMPELMDMTPYERVLGDLGTVVVTVGVESADPDKGVLLLTLCSLLFHVTVLVCISVRAPWLSNSVPLSALLHVCVTTAWIQLLPRRCQPGFQVRHPQQYPDPNEQQVSFAPITGMMVMIHECLIVLTLRLGPPPSPSQVEQ